MNRDGQKYLKRSQVQACDEKIAKEVISLRENERKLEVQKKSSKVSLDEFFKQMQDSDIKELNLIIKVMYKVLLKP